MSLLHATYGKAGIRVMRVGRVEPEEVREHEVAVMLEGEFDDAYTSADNARLVATDTLRNLVYVVAATHPRAGPEDFGSAIARTLLDRYGQVRRAEVTLREQRWRRLATAQGSGHPHGFERDGNGTGFARVVAARATNGSQAAASASQAATRRPADAMAPGRQGAGPAGGNPDAAGSPVRLRLSVESGVRGFGLLKTSGSGFSGFGRDALTLLADTQDRLCATLLDATWSWGMPASDLEAANAEVLSTMLSVFADTHSASLQDSLWRMGEAALSAFPGIERIHLACPNRHYIPFDLSRFEGVLRDLAGTARCAGADGRQAVFVSTSEPHGQIECTVRRG